MIENAAILIVAQNASTRYGGEAIIPVHYFRVLLERGFRVGLLAHVRNRDELEQIFGPNCDRLYYVEDTIWHRMVWQIGSIFPRRISEGLFGTLLNVINEHYQKGSIRTLVDAAQADIIHQPIPVSPMTPSSIHGLGVPVIIGPMNGGMTYPPGWEALERRSERYFVRFARFLSPILNRIMPGKAKADVLLVANERTHVALPVKHQKVEVLVENGVDLSTFLPLSSGSFGNEAGLRLVFLGRLVEWKALDFTLEALAEGRARGLDLTLDILGEGPDRGRLEELTRALGLEEIVRYHGFRSQSECVETLRRSDALILNSVYECGGAVVLEAMSVGLPVIASDWGGPADYVNASTGILVAPAPRETFAARLADAIEKLAIDPNLRCQLGEAGRARICDQFDWERKVDRMLEIYQEALSSSRAARVCSSTRNSAGPK